MKKNIYFNENKHKQFFLKLLISPSIMLATCILPAKNIQAQVNDFNFTNANSVQMLSNGETTTSSLTVADNIKAIITGNALSSTLLYTGATQDFRLGGLGINTQASLDMSTVNNFVSNNADHIFSVGGQIAESRTSLNIGQLILAKNNTITTSVFGVSNVSRRVPTNDSSSHSEGIVVLGATNTINADVIQIGETRNNGVLIFAPLTTGNSLILRASDGSSRVSQWSIGTGNASGLLAPTSTVDLTGGSLDAKINNLLIGHSLAGGTALSTGILIMDAGTLDANTITLGQSTATANGTQAKGILTINGGTVLTEQLTLGDSATTGTFAGIVNINNDAALRATQIQGGLVPATREINWNGGTIGNRANGEDMSVSGVNIKLSDSGTHTFQVDGDDAVATVSAALIDATTGAGGTLNKAGSGTLLLQGANTYTGVTNVNAGTLRIGESGSIMSPVFINSGAAMVADGLATMPITINREGVLSGSGHVDTVHVAAGGILTNAGPLKVDGDLNFASGGIYRVVTDQAHNTNHITYSGNVALTGAQLEVLPAAGNYNSPRNLVILSNAGSGVTTGEFSVKHDLSFLTLIVTYGSPDTVLNLARNNVRFADVAASENQKAVATIMDAASSKSSGDATTIIDNLTVSSADQARTAFDAIDGAGITALSRAAPRSSQRTNRRILTRLDPGSASENTSTGSFDTPNMLASNERASDPTETSKAQPSSRAGRYHDAAIRSGFWLRAYGGDEKIRSGDDNSADTHSREVGMSVGFDTTVTRGVVVGGAFSHGRINITADDNEKGDSNGNAVALYASYVDGPWTTLGAINFLHSNNNMRRYIAFEDINRTANASFGSNTVTLTGETSYAISMGGWTLQPLTGISTSYYRAKGFTETGADSLNLIVPDATFTFFSTQLGVKSLFVTDQLQWQPRAVWEHEFGHTSMPMSSQLQGFSGTFVIHGIDMPRDSLSTGLTVSAKASERVSLLADVQGQFDSRQTTWGAWFGLHASF